MQKSKGTAGSIVTVSDVIGLVKNDRFFPGKDRAGVLSTLNRLPHWANAGRSGLPLLTADTMPFNERTITDLFAKAVPTLLGVTEKRLRNAKSHCTLAMERYQLARKRLRVQLTPLIKRLARMLDKFHQLAAGKILAFLSVHELDPRDLNDAVAEQFRQWLHDHGIKNPDAVWRRNLNAWNKATLIEGWPGGKLMLPRKRTKSCLAWSDFPSSLELAVDRFFVSRLRKNSR